MAKYDMEIDVCTDGGCGWSHSETGYAEVELTDEEVDLLVDLIRENDGETDVDYLEPSEVYPDIYDKLYDACYEAVMDANEATNLINGFNNYFDAPDDLMERCERELGFCYGPDENPDLDKDEVFQRWLDDYFFSLDTDEKVSFMKEYYHAENMYEPMDVEVVIPEEIICRADTSEDN